MGKMGGGETVQFWEGNSNQVCNMSSTQSLSFLCAREHLRRDQYNGSEYRPSPCPHRIDKQSDQSLPVRIPPKNHGDQSVRIPPRNVPFPFPCWTGGFLTFHHGCQHKEATPGGVLVD